MTAVYDRWGDMDGAYVQQPPFGLYLQHIRQAGYRYTPFRLSQASGPGTYLLADTGCWNWLLSGDWDVMDSRSSLARHRIGESDETESHWSGGENGRRCAARRYWVQQSLLVDFVEDWSRSLAVGYCDEVGRPQIAT